jgi:type I restriction enzyme R subunit
LIDYDYIMNLIARFTGQDPKKKLKISREGLIGLINSDAKFMDEREAITELRWREPSPVDDSRVLLSRGRRACG